MTSALAALSPRADDGAPAGGPVAVDATDRLLLAEVQGLLAGLSEDDEVVVVDDRFGALTVGLKALGVASVRLHCDAVTAQQATMQNVRAASRSGALRGRPFSVTTFDALEPRLFRGARLVVMTLPRSLAELREVVEIVAREAHDDVVLLAGGRVKHMTRAMNDVLADSFREVRATLGLGKARGLVARGPMPAAREAASSSPVVQVLRDAELVAAARTVSEVTVAARGGVFAGAALDLGTRALLRTADRWPAAATAVDLGCGTGLLATVLALRDPSTRVVATDRSAAAVASAAATASANGVGEQVSTLRADAGAGLDDASFDLVLCNPPFHDRAALSTDAAHRMFETAARVLRPGGELWCVYNSVLRYRPALERTVGPTTQVSRDPRFTVTRSVRRSPTPRHASAPPPTKGDGA